jgi:hypothetical protein
MHRNRRPLALATLVSLAVVLASMAVLRSAEQNSVREAVAVMGIEGEGDIPLPVA